MSDDILFKKQLIAISKATADHTIIMNRDYPPITIAGV
jgi:hypothetical protein